MQIHPYLNFDGDTEAAMRFYQEAIGGKLSEIHRFGTMPHPVPDGLRDRVMHVSLDFGDGQVIMASDTMPGMSPPHVVGNHFNISISPDSREQADRVFTALSEGGTVTMPIADQFWGDYFGSLIDRFGVQWMVNYTPQRA